MKTQHSPSLFKPEEYEYIGVIYEGPPIRNENHAQNLDMYLEETFAEDNGSPEKLLAEKPFQGNHARRGTCDHCGAHFSLGVVYLHKPTDKAICVGHICAQTAFGCQDRQEYDVDKMRAKIKREKEKAAVYKLFREKGIAKEIETDHYVIRDIKRFALQTGYITDKQVAAVHKIAATMKAREQEEAEMVPVVEGKSIKIIGTVISVKDTPNSYDFYGGAITKILVKDDRGFKVWGTQASTLFNGKPIKGQRVEFVANVVKSNRDETFGFFKRPRKARRLNT